MNAVPRSVRRIQERVSQRDREWFEKHPGKDVRYREYIPGEFGPVTREELYGEAIAMAPQVSPNIIVNEMMEITQLAPGVRTRRPYVVLERREDRAS